MTARNRIRTVLIRTVVAMAILGLLTASLNAGVISYVQITNDADSGISADNTYTHALDFGTGTPGALINGVQFEAYNAAANGTLNFNREAATGSLSEHGGNAGHNVSGGLVDLMTDMYYNGNNAVDGVTTWTLSGLTAGYTYHARIYARQWGAGNNRLTTFVFDPDGNGPIADSTEEINQDDATSVGLPNDNDAYYINYEFTAVAGEDLVITLTQPLFNQSWHLYGLSNQEFATQLASSPNPEDGATDVSRDADLSWSPGVSAAKHDVYVGESFEDVDTATVPTASGLDVASYDPGRLELGRTYFWRVDEVNAAPDNTVFKGNVWSFTVEPFAYPIEGVIATSNGISEEGAGLDKTVDGSGLNAADEHSTESADMWLALPGAEPLALVYEFDGVYKLHEMLLWNYNVQFELVLGFGIKDVTVEYSTDGAAWTVLGDVEVAQATAAADYTANTTIDFAGVAAQYVRLMVNSGQGMMGQFGLSEVRFMFIPVVAREPEPASGSADLDPELTLSWRPGREAGQHNVYLDTDEQAVIDGTASMATVSVPSYDVILDLGQTYYWKVDEINDVETPAAWEGNVWSFSVAESLVVDDFESYDDEDNRIYQTWIDGYGVADNGSTVGNLESPFAETTLAHSGGQSMPFFFENAGGATVSEAERTFGGSQNWSQGGIESLSLFFLGDPGNTGGQLYVKINGSKVLYDGSAEDLKVATWIPWVIDLTGLNVQNVTTLAVGVEGAGAAGTLFVDNIRVYPYGGELITPVTPDTANLVAYYPLDGDGTDAAGDHDGTISGTPDFVAGFEGQAIDLASAAGVPQYVEVPYSDDLALNSFTFAVWINVKDLDAMRGIAGTRFNSENTFDFKVSSTYIHGDIGDGTAWLNTNLDIDAAHGGVISIGDWHHIAYAIDAAGTVEIYLDGALGATHTFTGTPLLMKPDQVLRIGSSYPTEFMNGMLDEVRIYDRALSSAEVAGLVGRPGPFYSSF